MTQELRLWPLHHASDATRNRPRQAQQSPIRRFAVPKGRDTLVLALDSVDWIEAQGNYVRLHTGATSHLVRGTLSSYVTRLDAGKFARINRSAIVNLDRIQRLLPAFKGGAFALLDTGVSLPVSAAHRAELERSLFGG